jgi:FkbM family methyltransferase
MNLLQKLRYGLGGDPLFNDNWFNLRLLLYRYLNNRRSRFGFQRLLKRLFRHRCITLGIKSTPVKMSMRYSDTGDMYAVREVWQDTIYDLEGISPAPDLIIDIGGHIGSFSVFISSSFPGVPCHVFEPDPNNFAMLQKNLAQNSVKATAVNAGLSNYEGKAQAIGHTGIGLRMEQDVDGNIRIVRLTDVIDISTSTHLLVKCDAENSEWAILDNIIDHLPANVFMYLELHDGPGSWDRLQQRLEGYDFSASIINQKEQTTDCIITRGVYAIESP